MEIRIWDLDFEIGICDWRLGIENGIWDYKLRIGIWIEMDQNED